MQPLLADRRRQLFDDVSLRPHLARAPVGQVRVVVRKAIMVLGDRDDVPGAGLAKQMGPGARIEVIGREHGNEILVAELGLRAVGRDVMLELARAELIHVARVPLVGERRNRIESPMNEDAELGVLVPRWRAILLQDSPVGAKWTARRLTVHGLHQGAASPVVLPVRVLPDLVDRVRIMAADGLCETFTGRQQRQEDDAEVPRQHGPDCYHSLGPCPGENASSRPLVS